MSSLDKQEEASYFISDLLGSIKKRVAFLMAHWGILLIMGTLGGLLGGGYAFIKKDTYTAATTFVVEDNKSSGGGIASALAGQFGLDLGGLSGGSGVLQGDNVLELLKSKLQTNVPFNSYTLTTFPVTSYTVNLTADASGKR